MTELTDEQIDAAARQAGATAYTNRFVDGSAFSFGPESLRAFVDAIIAADRVLPTTAQKQLGVRIMREKLKRPRARSCAGQCREMGVVVGDTIVGRETHANGDWSESKLKALFIGREECVFKTMRRNNYAPLWVGDGEDANWTLDCRDWYKLIPAIRSGEQ